jgi:hypothetical protein
MMNRSMPAGQAVSKANAALIGAGGRKNKFLLKTVTSSKKAVSFIKTVVY